MFFRLLFVAILFFLIGWKLAPGKIEQVKVPVDMNRPLWEDLKKTDESIIANNAKVTQYCYMGIAAAKEGDVEFSDVSMEFLDKSESSNDRFLFRRKDILKQLGY